MEEMESPTEGLQEKINEMAEEEKHMRSNEQWSLYVALTTAIIAVFAAVAGLLAGDHANQALILQVKSSNQWSYYQSKSIKYELADATRKIMASNESKHSSAPKGIHHKHSKAAAQAETTDNSTNTASDAVVEDTATANKLSRYTKEKVEIQKTAEEDDKLSEEHLHRHEILSRAVTMFQIAIAISAISILTRKRYLWWASMALSAVGIVFLVQGLL